MSTTRETSPTATAVLGSGWRADPPSVIGRDSSSETVALLPQSTGEELVIGRGSHPIGFGAHLAFGSRKAIIVTKTVEGWKLSAKSASGGHVYVPGFGAATIPTRTEQDPDPAPVIVERLSHGTVVELLVALDLKLFVEFDLGGRVRADAGSHDPSPESDLPPSLMKGQADIRVTPSEQDLLMVLVPDRIAPGPLGIELQPTRFSVAATLLVEFGTAFWAPELRRKKSRMDGDKLRAIFDTFVNRVTDAEIEACVPVERSLRTLVDLTLSTPGSQAADALERWIPHNPDVLAGIDYDRAVAVLHRRGELYDHLRRKRQEASRKVQA